MAIQRNKFDVAMELTELHVKYTSIKSIEELQRAFLKFYAAALKAEMDVNSSTLEKYCKE